MSEKVEKLLEGIQELTLLEASELVKGLEDKFGVSAAAASRSTIPNASYSEGKTRTSAADKAERYTSSST